MSSASDKRSQAIGVKLRMHALKCKQCGTVAYKSRWRGGDD